MTKQHACNVALKGASRWRLEWKHLKQRSTTQKDYIAKGNSTTSQCSQVLLYAKHNK